MTTKEIINLLNKLFAEGLKEMKLEQKQYKSLVDAMRDPFLPEDKEPGLGYRTEIHHAVAEVIDQIIVEYVQENIPSAAYDEDKLAHSDTYSTLDWDPDIGQWSVSLTNENDCVIKTDIRARDILNEKTVETWLESIYWQIENQYKTKSGL